jgi:endonuclease III
VRRRRMTVREKRNKILRIMKKLLRKYGRKEPPSADALLDRILLYLLYYGGNATAARRVLKALREKYVDLNEVRVTGLAELGALFEECGASATATPLVKRFLRQIFADRGNFNLDFLQDTSSEQLRKYLVRTGSLPPHAVSYVIASTRGSAFLPVEENTFRLARKLSLVEKDSDLTRCEQVLRRTVPKKKYLEFYFLVLEHGKKICRTEPLCSRCVLLSECGSPRAKAVT